MSSSPLSTGSSPAASDSKGVKLPKLDVLTFDGNILNWCSFWEQFRVSVHNCSTLSDSEKLVYLQHLLKDGSAKSIIEGLSCSGDNYSEAEECFQALFDHPRLIHQTHVRMISEAPALKGRHWQGIMSFTRYDATAPSCSQGHGLRASWYVHHLYWSLNWIRTPCLSGSDTAKSQLTFLTSLRCWNSELKLRRCLSLITTALPEVGIPLTEEAITPLNQLLPSLPIQILPLIASSVEQTNIHSTSARRSSLFFMRRCYLR